MGGLEHQLDLRDEEMQRLKSQTNIQDEEIQHLKNRITMLEKQISKINGFMSRSLKLPPAVTEEHFGETLHPSEPSTEHTVIGDKFGEEYLVGATPSYVNEEHTVIGDKYGEEYLVGATPSYVNEDGTRVAGKDFFRQARSRLSYAEFGTFLGFIKELNANRLTKEDTLRKAYDIFGPDNNDLYVKFEGLMARKSVR